MKLSRAPARAYPFRQRMHALILPATRAGGLAFLVRQAERERKAAEDGGGGPEVAPETESEEEEEEKEEEEEEEEVGKEKGGGGGGDSVWGMRDFGDGDEFVRTMAVSLFEGSGFRLYGLAYSLVQFRIAPESAAISQQDNKISGAGAALCTGSL